MKRNYVNLIVRLHLPNGETPTIDESWKADQKVSAALSEILENGIAGHGFILEKMDISKDVAFVLTHEDA